MHPFGVSGHARCPGGEVVIDTASSLAKAAGLSVNTAAGPWARGVRSREWKARQHRLAVPTEVVGEPPPQSEATLTRRPIHPTGRDLGDFESA